MKDISSYIQVYYKDWARISSYESYKWVALKHYRENQNKNYNNFNDWINTVYGKTRNLLTSSKYLPLGMLQEFSVGMPNELKFLFDSLTQPTELPTIEKVREFIDGTKAIMQSMSKNGYRNWKEKTNLNTYQDAHAISVYLAMSYPNNFYIYKYSAFRDFSKIIGYPIKHTDPIKRLFEYQALCDKVKIELKKNDNLIRFYKNWLKDHNYEDSNLNLLTQDFIYAVARHLNSDTYKKIKGKKSRVGILKQISAKELNITSNQTQHTYNCVKNIDYNAINAQNKNIGLGGELWVVNYEKERLTRLNLNPNLVKHTSKEDGDGYGYDILSLEDDGKTTRYIEVKTTSGGEFQPIYFSNNELKRSIEQKDHYYLYRVYNFKAANAPADLTIIKTSLDELNAEPISYKATIFHD